MKGEGRAGCRRPYGGWGWAGVVIPACGLVERLLPSGQFFPGPQAGEEELLLVGVGEALEVPHRRIHLTDKAQDVRPAEGLGQV